MYQIQWQNHSRLSYFLLFSLTKTVEIYKFMSQSTPLFPLFPQKGQAHVPSQKQAPKIKRLHTFWGKRDQATH